MFLRYRHRGYSLRLFVNSDLILSDANYRSAVYELQTIHLHVIHRRHLDNKQHASLL